MVLKSQPAGEYAISSLLHIDSPGYYKTVIVPAPSFFFRLDSCPSVLYERIENKSEGPEALPNSKPITGKR